MKTVIFKVIFLISTLLLILLLSGCGGTDQKKIIITMKNNSSEEIHLWTTGESIDPSNKLASGESRSQLIPWLQEEGPDIEWMNVTVYAGRSGATITSKVFKVKVGNFSVVYSGGTLSSVE